MSNQSATDANGSPCDDEGPVRLPTNPALPQVGDCFEGVPAIIYGADGLPMGVGTVRLKLKRGPLRAAAPPPSFAD